MFPLANMKLYFASGLSYSIENYLLQCFLSTRIFDVVCIFKCGSQINWNIIFIINWSYSTGISKCSQCCFQVWCGVPQNFSAFYFH